jgi:L-serine deaminase
MPVRAGTPKALAMDVRRLVMSWGRQVTFTSIAGSTLSTAAAGLPEITMGCTMDFTTGRIMGRTTALTMDGSLDLTKDPIEVLIMRPAMAGNTLAAMVGDTAADMAEADGKQRRHFRSACPDTLT